VTFFFSIIRGISEAPKTRNERIERLSLSCNNGFTQLGRGQPTTLPKISHRRRL